MITTPGSQVVGDLIIVSDNHSPTRADRLDFRNVSRLQNTTEATLSFLARKELAECFGGVLAFSLST